MSIKFLKIFQLFIGKRGVELYNEVKSLKAQLHKHRKMKYMINGYNDATLYSNRAHNGAHSGIAFENDQLTTGRKFEVDVSAILIFINWLTLIIYFIDPDKLKLNLSCF